MNEYGSLSLLVAGATSLMTATGAIIMLVRRNADWEPLQENLGKGAKNIGAVITAVGVGLIWAIYRDNKSTLTAIAIYAAVATILFLIAYSFLRGMQSYKKIIVVDGTAKEQKIIGGFALTMQAKMSLSQAPDRAGRAITIQELYAGNRYDEDIIWTRPSLELAKILFIIGYVGLISSGTIAITATALRIAVETS